MPKTRAKNKSPASKSGTSPAKKPKIMMKETDLETPCFIVDMDKERIILLKKVPWLEIPISNPRCMTPKRFEIIAQKWRKLPKM